MKFTIDEDIVQKQSLTIQEFLLLLLVKTGVDVPKTMQSLLDKEIVVKNMFGDYMITQRWADICDDILLSSEKSAPKESDLSGLAVKMMALVPQCKKEGTPYYFKCNKREITLKLKKFNKLYGSYSENEILDATKRYVDSFNGNYTFMRLLKYFILKEERKTDAEGKTCVEEVSMLATLLENKDSNDFNYSNLRLL